MKKQDPPQRLKEALAAAVKGEDIPKHLAQVSSKEQPGVFPLGY